MMPRSALHGHRRRIRWLSLLTGSGSNAHSIRTLAVSLTIMAVNLITGIATARYLGPSGKGYATAMTLCATVMANCFMLGLPSALLFNMKKRPEQAAAHYGSALAVVGAAGLTAVVAGFFLLPLWLDGYPPGIVAAARLFLLTVPVLLAEYANNAALQAMGEFNTFNVLRMLPHLGTCACLAALMASGMLDPYWTALAYGLPTVPITLALTVRLWRKHAPRLRSIRTSLRPLLRYGSRSAGNDLMGTLSLYADQLVVALFLSSKELGLYLVVLSLSRVVNVAQSALVMVLFPKAAGMEPGKAAELVKRLFRVSIWGTMLIAAAFMLVGPWLIRTLYGPAYGEAVPVYRLLLLEVVLSGAALVLSQSFMSAGKPGVCSLQQSVGLGVLLTLLVGLAPRFGIVGAGVSLLSATAVRFGIVWLAYPRVLKIGLPGFWPTLEDIRWLIANVTAGGRGRYTAGSGS
ncbi:lipopolysaccharide biosynthesis protein [Paenibacillus thermoaerophilus]|uniref:Lipopolysaccharide biosynthesis protein n=1 Tax=Paenibacillus thermoaerophilus TaxID=1215385 RepID=A0ABW2V457_9BACL|nr:oligosaccharide flippase family protein [Paenibacillus thermoaerophilus]TMV16165.1 hypothetical protein FE781_08860 [Paenibacillus thermoaerophilus]